MQLQHFIKKRNCRTQFTKYFIEFIFVKTNPFFGSNSWRSKPAASAWAGDCRALAIYFPGARSKPPRATCNTPEFERKFSQKPFFFEPVPKIWVEPAQPKSEKSVKKQKKTNVRIPGKPTISFQYYDKNSTLKFADDLYPSHKNRVEPAQLKFFGTKFGLTRHNSRKNDLNVSLRSRILENIYQGKKSNLLYVLDVEL